MNEFAPETIVRLAREHGGSLNLIAIGPLTNIALALQLEPALPQLICSITIMGGSCWAPGNVSAVAEANLADDAEAAALVLAAPWPITMVPLDLTMRHILEESDRQQLLRAGRVVPETMGAMLGFYFEFYRGVFGRSCSALHDPLAVAIATGSVLPRLAPTVAAEVDHTAGPGRGQLICDLCGKYLDYLPQEGAHCRVVLDIEEPFAPKLLSRLLSY